MKHVITRLQDRTGLAIICIFIWPVANVASCMKSVPTGDLVSETHVFFVKAFTFVQFGLFIITLSGRLVHKIKHGSYSELNGVTYVLIKYWVTIVYSDLHPVKTWCPEWWPVKLCRLRSSGRDTRQGRRQMLARWNHLHLRVWQRHPPEHWLSILRL